MSAPSFVIKPTARHTATFIFLHGLGDTGNGWCESFRTCREPYIKYIFPNAPTMPVTLNAGFKMPSWFNLYSLSIGGPEDEAGIKTAAQKLREIIGEEEKLVPSNRIIVGGFSQGGSVALYTGLTADKPLAGLLGLSTWLPLHKSFPAALKWNPNIPIFQCHGLSDPVVQFYLGKKTGEGITAFGATNYTFKSYPNMAHSSSDQEMDDVTEWVRKILPEST